MSTSNENAPIPAVLIQLFDGETVRQYNVVSERAQREFCQLIDRLAEEARRVPLAA